MTTMRMQIVQALYDLVAAAGFFPNPASDPEALTLNDPEATGWRALGGGLQDSADVSDQDGPVEVTAEALGDDADGSPLVYDLHLKPTLAYACAGTDKTQRVAQRDQAADRFAALIAQDRTLGLDPQVYAVIAEAERRDDVPTSGGLVASTLIVTLGVDYVANTPAG